MNPKHDNYINHMLLLAFGLVVTNLTTIPAMLPTLAAPPRKIRWKPPAPPANLGIPGNRGQGGGQRGNCNQYKNVTPIVPITASGVYWGQTMRDRPTIWLNLPQGLNADLVMEITVRAVDGQAIGKQLVMTPTTSAGITSASIISVPFPATTTLSENQTYRWEVAFYCDADTPDQPFIVQGQIQRVAPIVPLADDPLEQAQQLADRGIWFDALTVLGTARRSGADPTAATLAWEELVRSAQVGMDKSQLHKSEKPIVD